MLHFRIEGPFPIEPLHEPGGKLIEKTAVERFWADESKSHLMDAVGCYVFGFRAGRGLRPVYVGQSKTGFRHECFEHQKLTHYNTALVKILCGTPIMFFVVKDSGPTHAFESSIDRVENFLTQIALAKNPELANVQVGEWAIQGVYNGGPGHRSKSALEFCKCLGIDFGGPPDPDEDDAECASKEQPKLEAANELAPGIALKRPSAPALG